MTPLPLLTYVLDTAMTEMVDVWLEGIDADTHQVEIGYCIEPYWEDYRAHIIRIYMEKEYE
jgi:hypothetical protein